MQVETWQTLGGEWGASACDGERFGWGKTREEALEDLQLSLLSMQEMIAAALAEVEELCKSK